MNELIGLFLYILFYYQLNNLLQPFVYNKFHIFKEEEPIIFHPIVYSINIFILYIFVMLNAYLTFFSKIKKSSLYTLSLIYLKYVLDNVMESNTIGIYQYEFRRSIMWLFTTPLILQLYCDMNKLTLSDVNAEYHIVSNFIHILLFPFAIHFIILIL